MSIPSEKDWRSEEWNVDTPYAYKSFLGKSLAEAEDLFAINSMSRQEDLMFMPAVCFRYYVMAYVAYLNSPRSRDDSDGASCFLGLIKSRKDDVLNGDNALLGNIGNALRLVGKKQKFFDAQLDIYGDFEAQALECLSLLGLDKDR